MGFIILQALDFPKPYNFPWLFGMGKFIIFISIPVYIFRIEEKRKSKVSLSILYLILILCSYFIPFWKIKANFYLSSIQKNYSNVVNILDDKGSFGFISLDQQGDSLRTNPIDFKNRFSTEELKSIHTFMNENFYVEIFEEKNGIALIYRRFLDNRSGFILCQKQECRTKMDSTNFGNENYYQFNKDWYHFSAR